MQKKSIIIGNIFFQLEDLNDNISYKLTRKFKTHVIDYIITSASPDRYPVSKGVGFHGFSGFTLVYLSQTTHFYFYFQGLT